jgi:hypothetical protein
VSAIIIISGVVVVLWGLLRASRALRSGLCRDVESAMGQAWRLGDEVRGK